MFHPLTTEYLRNPWPVFEKLREENPCHWSCQANSWVVSRYEDCKWILRANEIFARDRSRAGMISEASRSSIQTEDPPSQLVLRRRMMKALHSQDLAVAAGEAFIELSSRIRSHPAGVAFDLVSSAIAPAAMRLITQVLGVPGFDSSEYISISERLTKAMDAGLDPKRLAPGMSAAEELRLRVTEWFATPTNTAGMMKMLIGDPIVQAELERKGENYLKNTISGIFNAGFSTSLAVVTAIVELEHLQPGIIRAAASATNPVVAVNELLRYLSPAQATSRFVVQDVRIAETPVRRGDTVIVLMASANRDERQFEDPNRLDYDRSPNAHLAFAWGPHVCLGAQLATHWLLKLVSHHEDWLEQFQVQEMH